MSRDSTNSMDIVTGRSPRERKEILRGIITKAESLKDAVGDVTINTLDMCMEQTDIINAETSLQEKIRNQEQVLLDSEMMSISSKILKQCTHALTKRMSTYNYVEFAQEVVQHLRQHPNIESEVVDWSYLENKAIKCFKTTPKYSTLLGTLVPLERKEIIKRKPAIKDARTQIRRPENIEVVDKEEEGLEQTVKMKAFITRQYKTNHKPLDFFKLVLHPSNFGKTIENILQISFLVRDGKIQVTKVDSSGILVVQPCTKEIMRTTTSQTSNIQNVVCLNMDQWRILRDAYRIENPMINF